VSNAGINRDHTTPRPQVRAGAVASRANDVDDDDDLDEDNAIGARPPPPDPTRGLTPAWALRHWNSPADVAELDRLAIEALAQLTALERKAAGFEAELIKVSMQAKLLNRAIADAAKAALPVIQEALDKALAAERKMIMDLQMGLPLGAHTSKMWKHVKTLGADDAVRFTWQPPDPMLPRQTLPSDRIRHLQVSYPGSLWTGTPALDALAVRAFPGGTGPPPSPDALWLEGHRLPRARIFPASAERVTKPAADPSNGMPWVALASLKRWMEDQKSAHQSNNPPDRSWPSEAEMLRRAQRAFPHNKVSRTRLRAALKATIPANWLSKGGRKPRAPS
jgi:hypothetical protein